MGSIFQFLDMNIILKFAISKGKMDFNFSITMNNKEYRVGAFPAELCMQYQIEMRAPSRKYVDK